VPHRSVMIQAERRGRRSLLILEGFMDNANNSMNELLSLIDKKSQLFSLIMDITLEQKKDIDENQAKNIEELVNRKQETIDEVDEIDRVFFEELNLLKKQLNVNELEEVDFTKYPILRILKLRVEKIIESAGEIMEIEKYNKEKLTSIMNELKNQMKQISVGKKSIKAYEAPVIYNDGIYIDKKK